MSNFRDIKLNFMRNLIEVKHETREAVFEVLGTDGTVETYKVGQFSMCCKYKPNSNLILAPTMLLNYIFGDGMLGIFAAKKRAPRETGRVIIVNI